ncbi:MAG: hypothetical protein ACI9ND_001049 [Yoonia sp.]|jgi:hypothetical protein
MTNLQTLRIAEAVALAGQEDVAQLAQTLKMSLAATIWTLLFWRNTISL